MNKEERKSGVELLKIIAICLIVIYHVNFTLRSYVNYNDYTRDLVFLHLFNYFGHIGNNTFIVSSSWFLYETSSKVKPKKVINILLDSMFISILICLLFCIMSNTVLPIKKIIEQFIPDIFQTVWFIPCYVIVYMIHPLLNAGIFSLKQTEHLILCVISYLLYGILGLFELQPFYNYMVAFINIYFLVSYVKKYLPDFCNNTRINLLLSVIFSIILLIIILFGNNDIFAFNHLYNAIITPLVVFVFNVFRNFKIKSKLINYLSSLSMLVYCIHENILLKTYVRPILCEVFLSVFGNRYVLICLCLSAIVLFISILSSIIYKKTIGLIAERLSVKIAEYYNDFADNICNLSNRINDYFSEDNK